MMQPSSNSHPDSTTDTGLAMERAMYGPEPGGSLTKRQLTSYVALLIALVILAILTTLYNPNPIDNSPEAKVSITSSSFTPVALVVKVGTTVNWTNNDNSTHQVAADPYPIDSSIPGFDSGITLPPNSSYSYTFNSPGSYSYHDQLNPFALKGTVVVK